MSPEYSYIRVEKHQIKPSNKYYKLLDELCFKSKNLYNTGLYVERQAFLEKDQSFKTNKNKLINSDVNAAFQIIKKVYKTDYKPSYKLKINPIRINVA